MARNASSTTQTVSVACPGVNCGDKCGGEVVQASGIGNRRRKTVTVAPCSVLVAQGWVGKVASAWSHEQAADLLKIVG
jgi:hypothetical protein